MSLVDTVMIVLHGIFGSLWTGSILFFAGAVLPAAASGSLSPPTLSTMTTRLVWLTRISAVVFVATGGHLAANLYTAESLLGSTRGQLVVAMLVLWFVLVGVIEASSKRLDRHATASGVPKAIAETRSLFGVAAVLAVLLLVTAGLLTANVA